MSYIKKLNYEIVADNSFEVLRSCPNCGRKTHFQNTNKFRVNANGNQLDIWLIYQCEICKHTLKLAIYERQKVSSVPKEEYQRFLDNDEALAEQCGKSVPLFRKNKADIDLERLEYHVVLLQKETVLETSVQKAKLQESAHQEITLPEKILPNATKENRMEEQILLTIKNPYQLNIRPEKQLAAVLGLSRSQVKNLLKKEEITIETDLPHSVSVRIPAGYFPADGIPSDRIPSDSHIL